MAGPLTGIRVLDMTRLVPGAYCTLLLGDLGAEVLKIEEPVTGDYARAFTPLVDGESPMFHVLNRNKQSVSLNLKDAAAVGIFHRLAAQADVVVEGFRPGVADRLGVGYEALCRVRPDVVYAAISGFGQDSPYRHVPGHDNTYAALAGVTAQIGYSPAEPPGLSQTMMGDVSAGLYAALSILAALRQRDATGRGALVDVSITDILFNSMQVFTATSLATGHTLQRGELLGGGLGLFPCRDGKYISLGLLEDWFWTAFCNHAGLADLTGPRYATHSLRLRHDGEIRPRLLALFAGRDRDDWVAELAAAALPVAPVNELDEAAHDPHVRARGLMTHQPGWPPAAAWQFPFPVPVSGMDRQPMKPPPALGEHTDEVLGQLGLTAAEVAGLRQRGAV